MPNRKICLLVLTTSILLAGCESPNDVALRVGAAPESALNLRSLQTRRFDSLDERGLLTAASQTLQDLGFTITESSPKVGVIVGSKQRDAEETGQVVAQVAIMLIFAALGSNYNPVWDKDQSIHVTLVATPIQNSRQTEIRVAFDRHLTNNYGQLWRTELISDEKIYQGFFDKFSQSVFLEAHKI